MSTYLKNMAGYTHSQLKSKSYNEIQKLFDKEMKRVNTFVDMNSEVVKGNETRTEESSKRARDELESDMSKKQKIDEHVVVEKDDQEEAEMKRHIEIVKDDEVAIDAIPLATKPPVIVEYQIDKDGRIGYFKLIRADRSSKRYSSMIKMLQGIDREDLETLWKLVKAKHGITRREEDYERVLWGDLKVMFEPDIKSEVWRNLQGYKVTVWKLFDNFNAACAQLQLLEGLMLSEMRSKTYQRRDKGKFDGKTDEGFFVRYCLNSKAFKVFNSRTRIVEENMHIRFSENTPNVVGSGPDWLFNVDALTRTMNYEPIVVGTQSNGFVGTNANDNAERSHDDGSKPLSDDGKKVNEDLRKDNDCNDQEKEDNVNNTNNVNAASTNEVNAVGGKTSIELPFDPNMPALEDYSIFDFSRNNEDNGAKADMNNLDTTIQVSPIPTTRIHKDHPLDQVIGDLQSATQTRQVLNKLEEHRKNPKRVFLYGKIEEELYVCQPLGFEDPDFPDRVYKVSMRELTRPIFFKMAQRLKFCWGGWGWSKFMRDDLHLWFSNKEGQKKDGIFISQDKYVVEILKKFGFTEVKTASTPMETQKPLLKDEDGEEVDVIDRYLKGQPKLGLWYLKDSPFDLVAYTDSDYARASLDRKSTIGDFLNAQPIKYALTVNPTIYTSRIEQFWATIKVKTVNGEVQLHALVDGKKIIINESTVRRDLQLEDAEGIYCLPNSTIFEQLVLMGAKTTAWNEFSSTMASAIICLATKQKFNFSKYIFESMVKNLDNVSGNFFMYPRFIQVFVNQQLDRLPSHKRIYNAPSHTKKIFGNMKRVGKGFSGRVTPLFPIMVAENQQELGEDEAVHKELGDRLVRATTTASSLEAEHDSGGGLRRQETIGDTIAQTRVLDLEKTKTTQQNEIVSLKRRVKKLEQKKRSRTHGLKRLHKVGMSRRVESSRDEDSLGEDASEQRRRINSIDVNDEITLVSVQDDADVEMFDVNTLTGDEVFAEQEVAAKDVNLTIDEVTLSQALAALKSVKPKVDIQAKIKVDHELAQRLQVEEQEELSVEEKAKLFQQLLDQRRKHFAAKSAEEKRNKPPTQAQQRKIMCTYRKNMEGKKPKDMKNKSLILFQRCLTELSRGPVEDLDLVLWSDLKTMFEPHVEDEIWKLQQRIKSLLNAVSITAALIDVNAAQSTLVVLENFNENYSKCSRLLVKLQLRYKVNVVEGVNAASEEVSTEKAKKKTQESGRNSRPSVMPSARAQSTATGSKPKPRIDKQKWKATGRILKTVGLRWVPTGKVFTSSTTNVDNEPPYGSNTNITNLQECIQNLDSSAGTSINVQEEQTLALNAGTPFNLKKERIKVWIKENVISGRPRFHGTTLIQEISARQKSQGIRSLLTS
ncbi:putative ribonuclease H-like domain-containing protein [Tanacetum coccineum]